MGAFLAKTFVILVLVAAIFGGATYFTYELFIKPKEQLEAEQRAPATPRPPDPALPEFNKALAVLKSGDLLGARDAFTRFVDQNPRSEKLDEAKDLLGKINTDIFLTPTPAPEKQMYVVRSGDVLNKVARITKTTPELLMRANGMSGIILRINQQLLYTPAEFTVVIEKKSEKVVVLNRGKFFKQYRIRKIFGAAVPKKQGATPHPKQNGKLSEKIAWGPSGGRVIFTDKEYQDATFWVSFTVPGHTLYGEPDAGSAQQANKPPVGGIGLAPEAVKELAIMLTRGCPVTIES
jgi:LysM repeat protein